MEIICLFWSWRIYRSRFFCFLTFRPMESKSRFILILLMRVILSFIDSLCKGYGGSKLSSNMRWRLFRAFYMSTPCFLKLRTLSSMSITRRSIERLVRNWGFLILSKVSCERCDRNELTAPAYYKLISCSVSRSWIYILDILLYKASARGLTIACLVEFTSRLV